MRKHDRIIIDLAVQILRETVDRSKTDETTNLATVEVRLALRCLLPHIAERWTLLTFWDVAGRPGDSRFANMHPPLSGMLHQLHKAGLSEVFRY